MKTLKNKTKLTKGTVNEDVVNHNPSFTVRTLNEETSNFEISGNIIDDELNLSLRFSKFFRNKKDAINYRDLLVRKYPISEICLYFNKNILIEHYV